MPKPRTKWYLIIIIIVTRITNFVIVLFIFSFKKIIAVLLG